MNKNIWMPYIIGDIEVYPMIKISDLSGAYVTFIYCSLSVKINPCYPEGFPKHIFWRGVVATPLQIINTEGHITLNLLPVYMYGHPLSIDTKISTNH